MQQNPEKAAPTLDGKKDSQSVTPEGKRLFKLIDGVVLREAVTHSDERGEICEIFNPSWKSDEGPLVYIYQTSIRPGKLKNWVYHVKQQDRIFASMGYMKWVLYDMREDSPTKHMINEFYLSERRRGLLLIPPYVAHAVQNIGTTEALFINVPTRAYDHADPDKYRISVDSGKIPYSFNTGIGW